MSVHFNKLYTGFVKHLYRKLIGVTVFIDYSSYSGIYAHLCAYYTRLICYIYCCAVCCVSYSCSLDYSILLRMKRSAHFMSFTRRNIMLLSVARSYFGTMAASGRRAVISRSYYSVVLYLSLIHISEPTRRS